ncbi:tether containing UBX domain for GLUT4 isoform X1 [Vanessa atalanta]|uniref:tether containing UBX domain for GLUT4 isoform X1 n=2 Tax=Vanessa atalanta TaxID=42275 RepID=UPI001FCD9BEA|nr:tether containing UBX domain for GLUT4 isoform X1 [Vanessa atalanta]XP_047534690.1 tether containing UBX domain for GLUT4 isoform X1 [Vanessa atalanta]
MSRDIVVLTPNGRRVKVHCTPDTNILQLLEDVCAKQGLEPNDYDLKHHKHILDLTTTVRFCNLPNKAFLEMVEAEKKRVESNVTIGLMLNDGERMTGDFTPNTSLYDLIMSLAPNELPNLHNPTISYMRQEVTGVKALKEKSLRQLGLIAGRAILRLLDKTEPMQANISSVYRRVKTEKPENGLVTSTEPSHSNNDEKCIQGPSNIKNTENAQGSLDPMILIKQEKNKKDAKVEMDLPTELDIDQNFKTMDQETLPKQQESTTSYQPPQPQITQENLERRLRIEEEVTFIGSQKAIVFMPPDGNEEELSDLPDDFYELTIEEVRKIYHELQQRRIELENTPILTSTKREEFAQQASLSKINMYKNVVVRIQFPDNMILQGVFTPNNTIEEVQNFVKEHLQNQDKPFHIFTTPLKEDLDPNVTLLEAKFVPCVHMHFKWLEENSGPPYLREEIYSKKTTNDAACILASKYRAPSRRKLENPHSPQQSSNGASVSKSKVPKWFKK